MAWADRLQAAVYESPSGQRIQFQYENVEQFFTKHTTAFEFPGADGTFVQDLGKSGRRVPMRIFFSGDDYDIDAKTLMDMLGEVGVGSLEHPAYGAIAVVPFGRIARRDALKTRTNQAIIEVVFFETNLVLFPTNVDSPADDTLAAIAEYNEAAPVELKETLSITKVIEDVSAGDKVLTNAERVRGVLDKVAKTTAEVGARFDAVFKSINDNVDTFIGDPLALASQISILVQLPARSSALISDRLDAYADLLVNLTTNVYVPGVDNQSSNRFRIDDLFASGAVIGAVSSILSAGFTTRPEAVEAADFILDLVDTLDAWKDSNLDSLGVVDTGEVYRRVLDAASLAAGFLVQSSFSLKQERETVLVEPASPIDLEARFYGTVGENLDFLISSNELVGDEIFEVSPGRPIVFYV